MTYVERSFKTKKALKEAVARGEKLTVFEPAATIFGTQPPQNGTVALEGPSWQAHTWYAQATLENGIITKVR